MLVGAGALVLAPDAEGAGLLVASSFAGVVVGALQYLLRTHLFERARSRDYPQALSLVQAAQAVPTLVGALLAGWYGLNCYVRGGLRISAAFLAASAVALTIWKCARGDRGSGGGRGARGKTRNKRTQTVRDQECTCREDDYADDVDEDGLQATQRLLRRELRVSRDDGDCGGFYLEGEVDGERRLVWVPADSLDDFYDDEDDLGLLLGGATGDLDNLVVVAGESYADYLCGDQHGGPGILIGDRDDITSCAKVEQDLMYSEFEQNLRKVSPKPDGGKSSGSFIHQNRRKGTSNSSKQSSRRHCGTGTGQRMASGTSGNRLGRIWTLRRQSTEDLSLSDRSSSSKADSSGPTAAAVMAETMAVGAAESLGESIPPRSSKSGLKKTEIPPPAAPGLLNPRQITVIEEVSSSKEV